MLNEIEKAGDECPLSEEFCELNEDGEQVNRPPDVNVDADILQISGSIEGELGRKSGVLEDISLLADVSSTTVNRESSGNGAEDGFAYLSIDDTSGENAPIRGDFVDNRFGQCVALCSVNCGGGQRRVGGASLLL